MSDLVEFRHLKYVAAVAETANFTRAAERLFLAQPSLSKQIKDLEEELGFPIFIRTREGVRITAAGQMVVSYAQEVLDTRNQMIAMARAVHNGEVSPLRLGFSSFISPTLLESFRKSYGDLFPNSQLHLFSGSSASILQLLEHHSLDAALLPMPIDGAAWIVRQVAQSPLAICMRVDDSLSHLPSLSLAEIASRLKIFRDPDCHPAAHARLIEMLFEAGIIPEIACRAATPSDIQLMVRAGCGVALIDQSNVLEPGLITKPIAGVQWTADSAFVHRHDADHVALPYLDKILPREWSNSTRKRTASEKEDDMPMQLELLVR